jgi:DNA segregation ATPase FtsK/SpoIIIE-like protein
MDFKGGAAFDECNRLPHTVGMVTDLDEQLGERALKALEAEIQYRERLLRRVGVDNLREYLARDAPEPMPRLIVVIDEFATMAKEFPDFLAALVSVAQRGRTLGVHMILATQRPSGAVNENIKTNTNLRIALRVQDAQDSLDVIGRHDAPSSVVTGRGAPTSGPGPARSSRSRPRTWNAAGPTGLLRWSTWRRSHSGRWRPGRRSRPAAPRATTSRARVRSRAPGQGDRRGERRGG